MIYKTKEELINATISSSDIVLDIGFLGQGVQEGDAHWPHALIKKRAQEVYGLDLELSDTYKGDPHYLEASAEDFSFNTTFDVVFAGDLIEHLSNPGLFLDCVKAHLKPEGRLILTTPNTFNLFNITEKLTKSEPTTNSDHTFYFNRKVLSKLLEKNGMETSEISFLYTLGTTHTESWKKRFLNIIYKGLSLVTEKFVETLVVVAKVQK